VSQAPVIVVGAGGHAAVVADALIAAGRTVLGFVDGDPAKAGTRLLGLPVLGDDSALAAHRGAGIELANGLGGAGSLASVELGTTRRRVQRRLSGEGWTFTDVRHPSATIARSAELGPGVQVLAGAVVQPCARVGAGAIVNTRAVVEHHAQVGDFAHIAPGAVLCGAVHVGEESHVGAGAVVRQGIQLAARVVVAAGAAVTRDVHSGVVAGVPARALPHSPRTAT
jgi:sugar O-acyltransferase (sialic acid O-acetyltransferase NeuD family)